MKKSISVQFLGWTFAIAIVGWGTCVVFSLLGFSLNKDYWMYLPYLTGGLSPTIASYIVLKRNGRVSGITEWLKNIFDVKKPAWMYVFTGVLLLGYFIPLIVIFGITEMQPVYMLFVLMPLMLFFGGLEEAGWRYILQPELDRRVGFLSACLIVSVIWAVWHLPLFFIAGTGQDAMDFWPFALGGVGLTFALGALRRITGSVFLCVVFHSMINAGRGVFVVKDTFWGAAVTAALLAAMSILAVALHKRKPQKAEVE